MGKFLNRTLELPRDIEASMVKNPWQPEKALQDESAPMKRRWRREYPISLDERTAVDIYLKPLEQSGNNDTCQKGWKSVAIVPIHREDSSQEAENFKSLNLKTIPWKVLEHKKGAKASRQLITLSYTNHNMAFWKMDPGLGILFHGWNNPPWTSS